MTAPNTAGAPSLGLKEELLALVEQSDWTDEDKALARQIAMDYVRLTTMQLAGQDVAQEIAMARAAAANVGAAAALSASNLFFEGLHRVVTRLLGLWRT